MKKSDFLSENFHFFVVKCSRYLNRHVFVMIPMPNDGLFAHGVHTCV